MSEDKPDLAAVLDHYNVVFKPDRSSQKVLCPVHEEHVQSCSINLDEGWWNCHACNAKGDSWNLIMTKEGIDFAAAIAFAKDLALGCGSNSKAPREVGLFGREHPARRVGDHKRFRPSFDHENL
jgi:DNA primase